MKKLLFLFLFLILVCGCSKGVKEKDTLINTKIPYYIKNYSSRYLAYKEKNSNLSDEDIITRVNIGLDNKFYTNTKESAYLNELYVLVNKYYYLPSNYVPQFLEDIDSTYSNGKRMLVSNARVSFENMAKDALKEGLTIRAISTYRSYNYQSILYESYKAKDGADEADTYSARPGHSEHQTGLVVDVDNKHMDFNNFGETEEFKWMKNNAYKYGFILRYPEGSEDITGYSYEPWHYRYVGVELSTFMFKNNLTLDEYYARYKEKDATR